MLENIANSHFVNISIVRIDTSQVIRMLSLPHPVGETFHPHPYVWELRLVELHGWSACLPFLCPLWECNQPVEIGDLN